jgi:hypothetical protein
MDDLKKKGTADRSKINMREEHEVKYGLNSLASPRKSYKRRSIRLAIRPQPFASNWAKKVHRSVGPPEVIGGKRRPLSQSRSRWEALRVRQAST